MSRRSDSIVQRHGGILGLCSIVSSSPYDIPSYIPNVLMLLCNHPQDFHLIQVYFQFRHSYICILLVLEIDSNMFIRISSNSL